MLSKSIQSLFQAFFFCVLILTTQNANSQNRDSEELVLNDNATKARDYSAAYKKIHKEDPKNYRSLIYNINKVIRYYKKAQKDMTTANKITKSYYEGQINKQLPIAQKIKMDLLQQQQMQREIDSLETETAKLKNLDGKIKDLLKKAKSKE